MQSVIRVRAMVDARFVNENSVVLRLTYRCAVCARPFRMLFMGDAGAQSEARMLSAGAVEAMSCSVPLIPN